jgi:hypothetical protein
MVLPTEGVPKASFIPSASTALSGICPAAAAGQILL